MSGADSVVDVSQRQNIYDLIVSLERAEENMMDWMAEFEYVEDMDPLEAIPYLKDEREKVNVVKENILSSIDNAETFLKNRTEND